MKGCAEPERLYTFDVVVDKFQPNKVELYQNKFQEKIARVRQRLARDKYKEQIFSGEIEASGLF